MNKVTARIVMVDYLSIFWISNWKRISDDCQSSLQSRFSQYSWKSLFIIHCVSEFLPKLSVVSLMSAPLHQSWCRRSTQCRVQCWLIILTTITLLRDAPASSFITVWLLTWHRVIRVWRIRRTVLIHLESPWKLEMMGRGGKASQDHQLLKQLKQLWAGTNEQRSSNHLNTDIAVLLIQQFMRKKMMMSVKMLLLRLLWKMWGGRGSPWGACHAAHLTRSLMTSSRRTGRRRAPSVSPWPWSPSSPSSGHCWAWLSLSVSVFNMATRARN